MRNKQSGFSLIEVMISFVLIGVGALGLVKLQAYIEQRADYAMHSIEALNLAEQKLEWFRSRGASSANPAIPTANFATILSLGMMFHILSILCLGLYPLQPCRGLSKPFISKRHGRIAMVKLSRWS